MSKPHLISDYSKLLISLSYHGDSELCQKLVNLNALTPVMSVFTEDALTALTNFAFCADTMAEQIFITHDYASHIPTIKFSCPSRPYATLGVCLKFIPDLEPLLWLF